MPARSALRGRNTKIEHQYLKPEVAPPVLNLCDIFNFLADISIYRQFIGGLLAIY
jgi:hypothetical protein